MITASSKTLRQAMAWLASVLVLAFAGGGSIAWAEPEASAPAPAVRVTATIFPLYDWVREIAQGRLPADATTFLLSSGTDMHSFQPSVRDMGTIGASDLFLYVGGASDEWVPGVLAATARTAPNRRAVSMLEALGDRAHAEELGKCMEHAPHHHDGHDKCVEEDELDEHVWLSLRNAIVLTDRIADELSSLDPDGAPTYRANAATYADRLRDLDRRYAELRASARRDVLVFADRFPFRDLAADYDLRYVAAFSGCSAESEASFSTIAALAKEVRDENLPVVLTLENSRPRLAQTIVAASGRPDVDIRVLNSMQGVPADVAARTTYLEVMEQNLAVLREALADEQ